MSVWTYKKTLTLKAFCLFKHFELIAFFSFSFLFSFFLSVRTLKIEYNVSLSVAPTRLKELLNMVYHKGQSWDLYSFASILMIYLCIYHQILQNVICSRMTPHFILVTGKSVVQIQKTLQLCLDRISV